MTSLLHDRCEIRGRPGGCPLSERDLAGPGCKARSTASVTSSDGTVVDHLDGKGSHMNGVLTEARREGIGISPPPRAIEAARHDFDHDHAIDVPGALGRGP